MIGKVGRISADRDGARFRRRRRGGPRPDSDEKGSDIEGDQLLKHAGPEAGAQGVALGVADGGMRERVVSRLQREQGNLHVQQVVDRLQVQRIRQARSTAVVQRAAAGRFSLGTRWYVETEPASSLVAAGATMTFRLKNSDNWAYADWEREPGESEARPVFGVRDGAGNEQTWYAGTRTYPLTVRHTFTQPGRHQVFFKGRPKAWQGEGMARPGGPLNVTLNVDVVSQLTRAEVESGTAKAGYREEINQLEDPNAGEPEIAEVFKRIAVRRGIDLINRNKQEAIDLERLYTEGAHGKSGAQAAQEVQQVLKFDDQLKEETAKLEHRLEPRAGGPERLTNEQAVALMARIEQIKLVRASLVDAFPAMALAGTPGSHQFTVKYGQDPAFIQRSLVALLQRVKEDCDTTRQALSTGQLDILEADRVIPEVRQALGIDGDPRKRRAIDNAIQQHRCSSATRALGLAGVALALLIVPGLGPYLSAAVGLIGTGIEWRQAMTLQTAAGGGIREGVVSQEEAAKGAFWATISTMLSGLDVAMALKPLTAIRPHVAAAADRLVPRAATEAAAGISPRGAPLVSMEALEVSHPIAMSGEELTSLCQTVFRRPVRPMTGEAHFYGSWADYAAEFRRYWPDRSMGIPGGGYFNPVTGHLHVSPHGNLLTAIHEAVHKIADETFPMGRQLLGDFLDEGITEALVRARLGPRGGRHGYDAHVTFVQLLQGRVGRSTVENAVLHGTYRELRDAVRQALGGEASTHEFFSLLRRVGSDATGNVADPEALSRAIDLLGGMRRTKR